MSGVVLVGCTGSDSKPVAKDELSIGKTQKKTPSIIAAEKFVAPNRDATLPSHLSREVTERASSETDWFENVTVDLGIQFAYRDGNEAGCYQLLESVGGGVAAGDFNNDGFQDLYFSGGGTLEKKDPIVVSGLSGALYWNQGGTRFEDVTKLSGLQDDSLYTHGCTVCDLDADGFSDLVVAGFLGVQVWLNQGDGTFIERSKELGLFSERWNVTPAAADYDNDGLVDLYMVTYAQWQPDLNRRCENDQRLHDICGPTLFLGEQDSFYKNIGTGFVDMTNEVSLVSENRGLGIVAADFDENGSIDFLVVNDVQENLLYNNQNGTLTENGLLAGIAYSSSGEREGSMGIDVGDFNRDGWPDVWYANYSHQDNSLMQNIEGTGFSHREASVGLTGVSRRWVGFGTGFADFDCDGWEDIFVVNGHVAYERLDSPYYQPAQLFKNVDGQNFEDVTEQAGPYFTVLRSGRGAVRVDFNNDGAPDLAITHQNDPVAILKNRHTAEHWIRIQLVGVDVERSAVGAAVSIKTNDREITRWSYAGGSYLSHQDSRLLFPLQSDDAVHVEVTWLGGTQETFSSLKTGTTHVLVQGRSTDDPD